MTFEQEMKYICYYKVIKTPWEQKFFRYLEGLDFFCYVPPEGGPNQERKGRKVRETREDWDEQQADLEDKEALSRFHEHKS